MLYHGESGIWGHCLVELFRPAPALLVVILSELHTNEGPSITNAAADVWTLVEVRHAPDPGTRVVRVEHWDWSTGPTWDLVTLSRAADGSLHSPRWRRLTREELAALLG